MEEGSTTVIDLSSQHSQCRLCSASTNLISLLTGKCREKRDLMRKIVKITTGIEFQEGDGIGCICLTCTTYVYNFYIFQRRSQENEERLQAVIENSQNRDQPAWKKKKLGLEDIIMPDISYLKDLIVPWINRKKEIHFQQKNETDSGNFSESQDSTTARTKFDEKLSLKARQVSKPELMSTTTQTCHLTTTIAIQCNMKKKLKNIGVQTNLKTKNKRTQWEENIKSNLSDTNLKNAEHLACHKKNDKISSKIRCDETVPTDKKCSNNVSMNVDIAKISNSLERIHQSTHSKLIEMTNKGVQHDCVYQRNLKSKVLLEDRYTQTKISIIPDMCCEDEKKALVMDVKHETVTLSPNKTLHISTESLCKIETTLSPTSDSQNSTSTISNDLLAIEQKVQYVRICPRCDETLYSKSEVMKHNKKHMICPYCKKSFTSIKKTDIHKGQECDKKVKTALKVVVERLKFFKDTKSDPKILFRLTNNCYEMSKINESVPVNPPSKKIKLRA